MTRHVKRGPDLLATGRQDVRKESSVGESGTGPPKADNRPNIFSSFTETEDESQQKKKRGLPGVSRKVLEGRN